MNNHPGEYYANSIGIEWDKIKDNPMAKAIAAVAERDVMQLREHATKARVQEVHDANS